MRNLGAIFAELIGNSDPDEMCSLFVNLGMECEQCHSDGEPYCLPFHIFDFMMHEAHGTLKIFVNPIVMSGAMPILVTTPKNLENAID